MILESETYAINGAAMEVHRQLGCGFLEAVYQEALEIELKARSVPFQSQKEIQVAYKGIHLNRGYIADFLVFDQIIVEIKAIHQMSSLEEAQLLSYLKATGLPVGLLLNFGANKLQWKRMLRHDGWIHPTEG